MECSTTVSSRLPLGPRIVPSPSLLTILSVLPILALAGGCSDGPATRTSSSFADGRKYEYSRAVYQLRPGDSDTDKHVGYLGRQEMIAPDGLEEVVFNVYDRGWRLLGFYTVEGVTYRYAQGSADYSRIGIFQQTRSLEMLYELSGPFDLRSVPRRS